MSLRDSPMIQSVRGALGAVADILEPFLVLILDTSSRTDELEKRVKKLEDKGKGGGGPIYD